MVSLPDPLVLLRGADFNKKPTEFPVEVPEFGVVVVWA